MTEAISPIQLSIIVPVGRRYADAEELYRDYKAAAESLGIGYEIIFVLDGPRTQFADGLKRLSGAGERFTVVSLTRWFGEAAAIMAGFEHSKGVHIVTLPAYFQIEHGEIGKLVAELDSADVVIARRRQRAGNIFERTRRRVFHRLLAWITRLRFHDLGCIARAMKPQVLAELQLYGDQSRFLPVLASRQGFNVREIDVKQSSRDRFTGVYKPSEYARSLLDIFTIFFLVRFTKKPLRFFGMLGVSTFAVGALLITYMVVQRLFFDQALASRPALLLASLMVVLGLQLFAIGLLGELMIFTHAKHMKDYKVDEVIEFSGTSVSADRQSENDTSDVRQ